MEDMRKPGYHRPQVFLGPSASTVLTLVRISFESAVGLLLDSEMHARRGKAKKHITLLASEMILIW